MDATHGTNPYGYPMYALSISDEHGHGVPGAIMITNSESKEEVKLFLQTVTEQIRTDFAEVDTMPFSFSYAMIDKSKAEMAACRELGIKSVLCFFHVLQELQRFVRSAESGVKGKSDQQRIMREVKQLKLCNSRQRFLELSHKFQCNNAACPEVLSRYIPDMAMTLMNANLGIWVKSNIQPTGGMLHVTVPHMTPDVLASINRHQISVHHGDLLVAIIRVVGRVHDWLYDIGHARANDLTALSAIFEASNSQTNWKQG